MDERLNSQIAFYHPGMRHHIGRGTILSAWFILELQKYLKHKAEQKEKAAMAIAVEKRKARLKKVHGDEIAMPEGKAKASDAVEREGKIAKRHKKVQLAVEKKKPHVRKNKKKGKK